MTLEVAVSGDARRDVEEIHRFIAEQSGVPIADNIAEALEAKVASLSILSARGNIPKELVAIGRRDYRELHYKPWRIIYRLEGRRVIVYAVVDGRRNMEDFLRRRLTRMD